MYLQAISANLLRTQILQVTPTLHNNPWLNEQKNFWQLDKILVQTTYKTHDLENYHSLAAHTMFFSKEMRNYHELQLYSRTEKPRNGSGCYGLELQSQQRSTAEQWVLEALVFERNHFGVTQLHWVFQTT